MNGLFTLFVLIFILLTSNMVLFPVVASNPTANEINNSNAQTPTTQVNEFDYIRLFTDIGIALITLLGGIFSARYIVNRWQTKKEISDLRKQILIAYADSFHNYATLMDNLVVKLVMEFAQLKNNNLSNKPILSKLLPWGYTFDDLNYYSDKVPKDENLTDFKDNVYEKKVIQQKFQNLTKANRETYIQFEVEKLNDFRNENEANFKKDFYETRKKLMGFKAYLGQYYEDSKNLISEFSAMWEYMMACYILLNKILISENEQQFIESLEKYNTSVEFLFDMMVNYERKLVIKNIKI